MKSSYTKLTLLILFVTSFIIPKSLWSGADEEEMKDKLPLMLGQSNLGQDFWFSIPPVYERESGGNANFVKVLIVSPESGKEVKLEIEASSFEKKVNTIKNTVVEIQIPPAIASAILHDGSQQKPPPGKVYKGRGIHLTSEVPIVAYVIVKYKFTTDGFLALPANAMGTEYINMVYKEPDITSGLMAPFTAVTAAYDNTEIKFTMGGGDEGNDAVPLVGNRLIKTGESATESLMKGDVWLLSIDDNRQDLSGSLFEANKPFSLVSGVHCANFPFGNAWCDYTVEMELPTHTWGNTVYVTPMMNRTHNGIIRIFASEDNTEVFRDGSYLGTIKKGGGAELGVAYLETRVWSKFDENGEPRAPKIAAITADKPIQVMYYNTGTQEDEGSVNSDPFMMQMTPIDQARNEIYFATPNARSSGSLDFTDNFVNLIFELHDNYIPDDLLFAVLPSDESEPEWRQVNQVFGPSFDTFVTTYNGTKYATTTLALPNEGVFGIKSDSTKFLAYSHGYGPYESYGYPTMAWLNDLKSTDTKSPNVTFIQEEDGDVKKDMGSVKDLPNDGSSSNIAQITIIDNLNENYELNYSAKSGEFIPGKNSELNWWLTVKDKEEPANAILYFIDRAGNDTLVSISYDPSAVEPTNVAEIPSSQYRLYPTPSTNYITVSLKNSASIIRYEIFDIDGNSILSGEGNKSTTQTISTQALSAGTYMIKIVTANNEYLRDKFIKQ